MSQDETTGGEVAVDNSGSIFTEGEGAYAILAQSVGGGGGNAVDHMVSAAIDGVEGVSAWSWFQGVYKDNKPENFFARFAVDPVEIQKVRLDYTAPPEQWAAFVRDRHARKAIDSGNGKAVLATMGGGTLTATREGGKVVLTDGAGAKATVSKADERYSNGVVHRISGVLMPQQGAAAAAPAARPRARASSAWRRTKAPGPRRIAMPRATCTATSWRPSSAPRSRSPT